MADTLNTIAGQDLAQIQQAMKTLTRVAKKIDTMRVSGAFFKNAADTLVIEFPARRGTPENVSDDEFDGVVQGNEQDGENKRWYYGWSKSKRTDQGYGKVQPDTGLTGAADDPDTRAINLAEEINGTSGLMGNGTNTNNLPTNNDGSLAFDLQPLPDGTPVRIRRYVAQNGKTQYAIIGAGMPNGIDGTCPAGSAAPTADHTYNSY